jgi:Cu/Ag efflux protein CusF
MKTRSPLIAALCMGYAVTSTVLAAPASEQAHSQGTVKKLDAAAGRITLVHGPIDNLAMPAMTMTFELKDKAALRGLKVGDKVLFHAEQIGDKLVVTQLKH